MGKVTRVRTGCWTCKKRHRKCDETKPACNNCTKTDRICEGYERRLQFDTDGFAGQPSFAVKVRKPGLDGASFSTIDGVAGPARNLSMAVRQTNILPKLDMLNAQMLLPQGPPQNMLQSGPSIDAQSFGPAQSAVPSLANTQSQNNPMHAINATNGPMIPEAAAKSPLSQAWGDLFPSHMDMGKLGKTPLDSALDDILAVLANPEPTLEKQAESYSNFNNELLLLIGKTHAFDDEINSPPNNASLVMSYQEENRMLKHFFQNLLPLLDAHPQSPWPSLALRYCDFDVARSCFISLACIHIFESRKGGNEYYDKGMAHIHSTMTHLIESISSSGSPQDSPEALAEAQKKTSIQSFVILVLINVHILFAVLEKGRSSLSRYLFKVFGAICQNNDFYQSLMKNESKGSLVVVLSWYDTVSAITSPDCRLPYCSPDWYGSYGDVISTLKMMGCPGEIFRALSEVCILRHEIFTGNMSDGETFHAEFDQVKQKLLNYREYVQYEDGEDYVLRLKGAQCWSLAVYVSLLRLIRTEKRALAIRSAVSEFLEVYGTMPSDAPILTQMVWPLYAMGCECASPAEREMALEYMDTLYETAQMGTLASLRWIVRQVWQRGISQEEVLTEWLDKGVDYHPL